MGESSIMVTRKRQTMVETEPVKPQHGLKMDGMLGVSHTNFFEQRVTDYSKGATTGTWADVWGKAA